MYPFEQIFESAPIGMALVSLDGRWLQVNRALCTLVGYDAAQLLELTQKDVTHPDDLELDLDHIRKLLEGELTTYQMEKRYIRADWKVVNVMLSASLVRDDAGRPVHFVSQIQDVTEQRQMEEQLRQAQKLEAIGLLAGGIAHDFNNMLSVIMGHADAALESLTIGQAAREDVAEVKRASVRAGQLTKQLLAFGRRQFLSPRVTPLCESVRDLEKMLLTLVRGDIELTLPQCGTPGNVYADPGQIAQIVMNLVVNARDAMPKGGRLTLDVTGVEIDETLGAKLGGARSGAYMMLTVADTGHGMDRATQLRIFEPFFTTKAPGTGTGLGLSTVFGIVKQSCGYIAVESVVGSGSTFRVYLPRTDRAPTEPVGTFSASPLEGGETILLVDDDQHVRAVMRNSLRRRGYDVLEAQGPGDALVIAEKHPGRIDLLVTDVVMPRMSGPELVERVTALRPGVRVLMSSGYPDDVSFSIYRRGAFLQKPFASDDLLRKVREAIDHVVERTGVDSVA